MLAASGLGGLAFWEIERVLSLSTVKDRRGKRREGKEGREGTDRKGEGRREGQ